MMKSCELCKMAARTYCESDQASLCWECDAKVHGANFLVARHVRCLLCHTCQTLTPWRAAGAQLGQTVSVCDSCVNRGEQEESEGENGDEDGEEEEEEEDSDDDVSVGVGTEEDGDNQVVPWFTVANTPPPAASSSSASSEDYCGGEGEVSKSTSLFSLKRLRDNNASDLPPQENIECVSPKRRCDYLNVLGTRMGRLEDGAVSVDSMRLSKEQQIKTEGSTVQLQSDERDAAGTESLKK